MMTVIGQDQPPEGFLDVVQDGFASGWAAHVSSPCPLEVALVIDGNPCSVTIADRYRPDVAKAGFHRGFHGFHLTIPPAYQDGAVHQIDVFVVGFDQPLNKSPAGTDQAAPSAHAGYPIGLAAGHTAENPGIPLPGFTRQGRMVAFYIEPMTFRRDPRMLVTWTEWACAIAAQNTSESFAIISSQFVCGQIRDPAPNVHLISLATTRLLAHADDRIADYVADLHDAGNDDVNVALLETLRSTAEDLRPDLVISFTENRYLADAFRNSELAFAELGTLPQLSFPPTLFIDPVGHQAGMLNGKITDILSLAPPITVDEVDRIWDEFIDSTHRSHPFYRRVFEWMYQLRASHVVLAIMQPADHPNYREFTIAARPEELLKHIARNRPDSLVIPTFHRGDVWSEPFKECLSLECSNLKFLPSDLQAGLSELMVGMVHEVVTLSSNTGFTALLHGTPVTPLGSCRFAELARHMRPYPRHSADHRQVRRNLLALFSNGYLHDLTALMTRQGFFSSAILQHPSGTRLSSYFNFSAWSPSALRGMLQLPV